MRKLAPALPCPAPATQALALQALVPVSERVADLLKPERTIPRYSDYGFEGNLEIWNPKEVAQSDIPMLEQQLRLVEHTMEPSEPGALLARIHTLLSQYRDKDLPAPVEAAIAQDWLEDLGEFPIWVVVEACKQWRRHPTKFRFKPLIGDILNLCREIAGPHLVQRDRLRKLLSTTLRQERTLPPSRPDDIRSRVIALAAAKRMPT